MPTPRRPLRLWDAYGFPRIPSESDGAGDFRRPGCLRPVRDSPVKETASGTCGWVQRAWYDRTPRRVRDLGCGGLRIHLEPEVRRVAWPVLPKLAPSHPHESPKTLKKYEKSPRKRQTVPITPSVLEWAMTEAGYTAETLANALKKVKVSAESIRAWLAGSDEPALPQFRRLARVLARIPSVFLLPAAPTRVPSPAVEFRHPPEGRDTFTPGERKYIREAARLQNAASWLTGELGEREAALPQVRVGMPAENIAAEARLRLTGSLNGSFSDRWKSEAQAFQGWRGVLEQSGVFVFVFPLGQKSCRGFSLWNGRAPLVAVNSAWRYSARTFTLFHEYGHLLTRTSSACVEESPTSAMRNRDSGDPAERWCEHFSAAFLMPREPLLEYLHGSLGWPSRPATLTLAQRVANHFKVSLRAATLRLIEVQAADWALYREIPAPSDAKSGGGRAGETRDRGIIKRNQYGQRTVDLFVRALHRDVLARSDVLDYLDVTDTHLDRFERTGSRNQR